MAFSRRGTQSCREVVTEDLSTTTTTKASRTKGGE
jgi:hypothetical protein